MASNGTSRKGRWLGASLAAAAALTLAPSAGLALGAFEAPSLRSAGLAGAGEVGGVTFALADSALAFASNTGGRVTLSVENVLNTAYRDYLSRFRYFSDHPGRNVVVRLRVPFGHMVN